MNLFYRRLVRYRDRNGTWGCYSYHDFSLFTDVDLKTSKISGILHSIFNFDAGDVYGWPCENISKEEIDKLWDAGQRAFVLDFGNKEVILYDLKMVTTKEYHDFYERSCDKEDKAVKQIVELVCGDEDDDSTKKYIAKESVKILREHSEFERFQ